MVLCCSIWEPGIALSAPHCALGTFFCLGLEAFNSSNGSQPCTEENCRVHVYWHCRERQWQFPLGHLFPKSALFPLVLFLRTVKKSLNFTCLERSVFLEASCSYYLPWVCVHAVACDAVLLVRCYVDISSLGLGALMKPHILPVLSLWAVAMSTTGDKILDTALSKVKDLFLLYAISNCIWRYIYRCFFCDSCSSIPV